MWLNRAGASAHGELTNVAMMQLCSSTEFITWGGLMLSVHGKKRNAPDISRKSIAEMFPPTQQSQDIQPYSNN